MVEPPGTAPGSDPLITSAFMSIVPKDTFYIGEGRGNLKREAPGGENRACATPWIDSGKKACSSIMRLVESIESGLIERHGEQ